MKHLITIIATLLLATWAVAQENAPSAPDSTRPLQAPRFLDLDGDGFNDLAEDLDADGIPDAIDPDVQGANGNVRWRWAWYRSMPDSAADDSLRFERWWNSSPRSEEWLTAWRHWRWMREQYGDDIRRRWWGRDNIDPRRRRMLNDPRMRRRFRDSGGGGGGGNGGGGGGGNSGGMGGGRGRGGG